MALDGELTVGNARPPALKLAHTAAESFMPKSVTVPEEIVPELAVKVTLVMNASPLNMYMVWIVAAIDPVFLIVMQTPFLVAAS